jgi:Spy/CpxP family protein refolding chaperone
MFKRSVVFGAAVLFLLSVPVVYAQQDVKASPEKQATKPPVARVEDGRVNARVEELTKKLNLTAEQQQKVKDILAQTSAAVRTIMKEAREKTRELMSKDNENIKTVLNDAQKKLMEKMHMGVGPRPNHPMKTVPPVVEKK